jgi:hypothetical protein
MQNKEISVGQLKAISAILARLKIDKEMKVEIVPGFSDGRTTTSKELTMAEARAMIQRLNTLRSGEAAAGKMWNKIIYLSHEMRWIIPAHPKPKADMPRITGWCKRYGYLHKDTP